MVNNKEKEILANMEMVTKDQKKKESRQALKDQTSSIHID